MCSTTELASNSSGSHQKYVRSGSLATLVSSDHGHYARSITKLHDKPQRGWLSRMGATRRISRARKSPGLSVSARQGIEIQDSSCKSKAHSRSSRGIPRIKKAIGPQNYLRRQQTARCHLPFRQNAQRTNNERSGWAEPKTAFQKRRED